MIHIDIFQERYANSEKAPEKMLTSLVIQSVQFSSVAQSCPTLCDPMNRSTPGLIPWNICVRWVFVK